MAAGQLREPDGALLGGWDPSRQLFWPHSSGVCFLASEGEKQNKCPHSAVVDSKIRLSIILVLWPPLYPHLPPFSPLLPHGPTFYPQNAPCSIPLQGLLPMLFPGPAIHSHFSSPPLPLADSCSPSALASQEGLHRSLQQVHTLWLSLLENGVPSL